MYNAFSWVEDSIGQLSEAWSSLRSVILCRVLGLNPAAAGCNV
jgi:hypothetical protein